MINKAKQSQTSSSHLSNKAAVGVVLAALCFTPGLGVQRAFAAPAEVPVSAPAVQTVTGTVVDATGEPIIGASVKVKGSNTGAVTDIDGNFTLRANTGDLIEISYVGMKTQSFTVTAAQSKYDIRFRIIDQCRQDFRISSYHQRIAGSRRSRCRCECYFRQQPAR